MIIHGKHLRSINNYSSLKSIDFGIQRLTPFFSIYCALRRAITSLCFPVDQKEGDVYGMKEYVYMVEH